MRSYVQLCKSGRVKTRMVQRAHLFSEASLGMRKLPSLESPCMRMAVMSCLRSLLGTIGATRPRR